MYPTKLVACLIVLATALSAAPLQPEHLVSPADLRNDLAAKEASRSEQVRKVTEFFDRESAVMKAAGLNVSEVKSAVAALDDASLAELGQRTAAIEAEVSGGSLNNEQLTYVVIALAAAVLVLVIVVA